MTYNHNRTESSLKNILSDMTLITRIQDLIKHCTGKNIKIGERLPFNNNFINIVVPGKLPLERIQRIAADTIELQTLECGQLYRHPWISLSEYDRELALVELRNWYTKGWIFPDVYERWKEGVRYGTNEDIQELDAEMHIKGRIIWTTDEIREGSKHIGNTLIGLQARLQTGKCTLNFLVPYEAASVHVKVVVVSHGRSLSVF